MKRRQAQEPSERLSREIPRRRTRSNHLPKRFSKARRWRIRAGCENTFRAAKNQATSLPQTTEHFPGAHEWASQGIAEGCGDARDRVALHFRWKRTEPALRIEAPKKNRAERPSTHCTAPPAPALPAGLRESKRRKEKSPRASHQPHAVPHLIAASLRAKRPWSLLIRFSDPKAKSTAGARGGASVRGDKRGKPWSYSTARGRHCREYRPSISYMTRPRTRTKFLDFRVET